MAFMNLVYKAFVSSWVILSCAFLDVTNSLLNVVFVRQ